MTDSTQNLVDIFGELYKDVNMSSKTRWLAAFGALLVGCTATLDEPEQVDITPLVTETEPAVATLKRLSRAQYENSIRDVFGTGLAIPGGLEPDSRISGLLAVGASRTPVSDLGVELYEGAAYAIAEQVMRDEARRGAAVPCAPDDVVDETCALAFVEDVGRKLWRRPLTSVESGLIVATATTAADTLSDFYMGLEFAVAALLQSPYFLFRVELGEGGTYKGYELATRLSFFFWNASPDAALLDAAAAGRLDTPKGVEKEIERLLASDRAREGVRAVFSDILDLHGLDDLEKDPTIFKHFSASLGEAAREETLLGIERLVFELDGDFRDLMTAPDSFIDRRLAAIYGVAAPEREGFGLTTLSQDRGRRGFLGQVSFLALQSHPAGSSAVKRGHFVRKVLLCGTVPPPPVNVDTALPEPSTDARTLRERNTIHLEDPACAGCHTLMDPIGLGFENFDGLGRWRDTDNGALIDASGDVDGEPYSTAWEMGEVIRNSPVFSSCMVKNVYRVATGDDVPSGQAALIDNLSERFKQSGYSMQSLMTDIAMSPGFQAAKKEEME